MLTSHKMNSETFNDGSINVLEAVDGVIKKNIFKNIHFGNRTFGINRFFNAEVAGNKIERMISIPFNDIINRKNLIELKDFRTNQQTIYEIVMLQPKYDTAPPSIYLTLKRSDILYDDERTD